MCGCVPVNEEDVTIVRLKSKPCKRKPEHSKSLFKERMVQKVEALHNCIWPKSQLLSGKPSPPLSTEEPLTSQANDLSDEDAEGEPNDSDNVILGDARIPCESALASDGWLVEEEEEEDKNNKNTEDAEEADAQLTKINIADQQLWWYMHSVSKHYVPASSDNDMSSQGDSGSKDAYESKEASDVDGLSVKDASTSTLRKLTHITSVPSCKATTVPNAITPPATLPPPYSQAIAKAKDKSKAFKGTSKMGQWSKTELEEVVKFKQEWETALDKLVAVTGCSRPSLATALGLTFSTYHMEITSKILFPLPRRHVPLTSGIIHQFHVHKNANLALNLKHEVWTPILKHWDQLCDPQNTSVNQHMAVMNQCITQFMEAAELYYNCMAWSGCDVVDELIEAGDTNMKGYIQYMENLIFVKLFGFEIHFPNPKPMPNQQLSTEEKLKKAHVTGFVALLPSTKTKFNVLFCKPGDKKSQGQSKFTWSGYLEVLYQNCLKIVDWLPRIPLPGKYTPGEYNIAELLSVVSLWMMQLYENWAKEEGKEESEYDGPPCALETAMKVVHMDDAGCLFLVTECHAISRNKDGKISLVVGQDSHIKIWAKAGISRLES
ncbi:hypothetical protein CONPUDRAFT_70150 [Coniophora puteana RWD-64-598 SS2]|uniref:Uncharacterized protein n=1 Tax=Coniophora puteana (strain RWD-64-598) TaxID=741705 RepID=A0A5M3N1P9_CONPW|nr:uncharacterized protein CONPUDRAFT_70150 [Coniophora puteana RWD-64-598 SS2]EIW85313.1 hypothetical protein CONPUDRAFT_70150 [Coniophora puteana RWD-64-598 SS2]